MDTASPVAKRLHPIPVRFTADELALLDLLRGGGETRSEVIRAAVVAAAQARH